MATHVACPPRNVAVQVPGCSKHLPMKGSRDFTCVRCEQVDDLLSMVGKLKEEAERLKSIIVCEQEIDL